MIHTLFTVWKTASIFPVKKAVVRESDMTLETLTAGSRLTVTEVLASPDEE